MFTISVDSSRLNYKLKEYARVAGKSMADAVKDEAAFVALGLTKLTPPGKVGEGKKRVAIDIGKVFLVSKWFLEVFNFRRKSLDERVKEAVRSKDTAGLENVFQRSGKLRRITVEGFSDSRHKSLRKHGRVPKNWHPGSFPIKQESQARRYEREKQKNVGLAKSGWAACLGALGRSVAGWLQKGATGAIKDDLNHPTKPSVTLTNKVSYASDLEKRKGIVSTVLRGRLSALEKKITVTMRLAARQAALS